MFQKSIFSGLSSCWRWLLSPTPGLSSCKGSMWKASPCSLSPVSSAILRTHKRTELPSSYQPPHRRANLAAAFLAFTQRTHCSGDDDRTSYKSILLPTEWTSFYHPLKHKTTQGLGTMASTLPLRSPLSAPTPHPKLQHFTVNQASI